MLLEEFSFIKITSENVVLTALHLENRRLYLRINETVGKVIGVRLEMSRKFKVKEIWLIDTLGKRKEKLGIERNSVMLNIGGFSLGTLEIILD